MIVTTAHAGSLTEAMQLLFDAMKVKSAAERNHTASRILGIIHMKRLKVGETTVLLPAMWRNTTKAVNNLTAVGLASLLPGCSDEKHENFSLGRTYFARILLEEARKTQPNALTEELRNEVKNRARLFDLRGE